MRIELGAYRMDLRRFVSYSKSFVMNSLKSFYFRHLKKVEVHTVDGFQVSLKEFASMDAFTILAFWAH